MAPKSPLPEGSGSGDQDTQLLRQSVARGRFSREFSHKFSQQQLCVCLKLPILMYLDYLELQTHRWMIDSKNMKKLLQSYVMNIETIDSHISLLLGDQIHPWSVQSFFHTT